MKYILNKKIISVLLVFLFLFFLSTAVLAADTIALPNPLGDKNNSPQIIVGNVIRALLGIVGSLALGVFILGGLTWVISAGNEEKVKKGKDMVMWAAFGLVLILVSYALVNFVITAIAGGSSSNTESHAQNPDSNAPNSDYNN
jgi:prepilin signal peptidase PulO-like enzyme (type II secretory pathway)